MAGFAFILQSVLKLRAHQTLACSSFGFIRFYYHRSIGLLSFGLLKLRRKRENLEFNRPP